MTAEAPSSPLGLSMSLTNSMTFHGDDYDTQSMSRSRSEVEEMYDHPCSGVATFRCPLPAGTDN